MIVLFSIFNLVDPGSPHWCHKHKKGARIEIQLRFKIQYPMKNHKHEGDIYATIACHQLINIQY